MSTLLLVVLYCIIVYCVIIKPLFQKKEDYNIYYGGKYHG